MTRTKALEILNNALKDYRRRFIFDANLYRFEGVESSATKKAHKKLTELDEAVETLLGPVQLELFE